MTRRIIIALCLTCFLFGCASFREKREEEREKRELQEENYQKLRTDSKEKNLFLGQTCENIVTLYGEPEDVFRSSSDVSSLEIWTYDTVLGENQLFDRPIRLYFSNCELTSWTN